MFEQNRRKHLYVTTLYVTGKILNICILSDKPYLGNVCLAHDLINFLNLLKK